MPFLPFKVLVGVGPPKLLANFFTPEACQLVSHIAFLRTAQLTQTILNRSLSISSRMGFHVAAQDNHPPSTRRSLVSSAGY